GDCIISRILLKNVFAMLPQDSFMRIHRSFIVSKSKVKSFNRQELVLINGAILPIGRQYASELMEMMSS
ncbi:MAG: LytTR family transcriptional regulator DNA-binding domain-containing protein, partial [Duncaniella sp.]|nr:LytTR family transcriptional regulator DNA-binding domain-containing protein [Duncaniella sp.]